MLTELQICSKKIINILHKRRKAIKLSSKIMEKQLKTIEKYAIVVAGGKGSRMGNPLPKQFIELSGIPILMHTLNRFFDADHTINIILVLPHSQQPYWQELLDKHGFSVPHTVVNGGATRFQSVRNGLLSIKSDEGLVAVHDGVRPFVTPATILHSFEVAQARGSAITCIPLKDSIREINKGDESMARDRSSFRLVQTPQTFSVLSLKAAYQTEELPEFTDCASVFEAKGYTVHLIEGNTFNIKITTPEDLLFGEALAKQESGLLQ